MNATKAHEILNKSDDSQNSESSKIIDPRLGKRIRAARKEKHMTIAELADKVGCSHTHITRLELAQRRIDSFQLLAKFSEVLNIPMEELLALSGQAVQKDNSLVKVAFPSISSDFQEEVIAKFATLVTNGHMTEEQIQEMLIHAVAFSEYCEKKNEQ